MRTIVCLFLGLLLCLSFAEAADLNRLKEADNGSFKAKDGSALLYALAEPENPQTGKRYPLVIFLHGAGGMGAERKWGRGKDGGWKFFQTMTEDCYFFMPQARGVWAGIGWGKVPYRMKEKPSKDMQRVMECIDWLLEEKAIDPNRVHIAGASMGSMGMWDLVCRRPETFAAGISCCGGFDARQAPKIARIRFRIFHGDKDPWVPIAGSQAMFDALKKAGADVDFHIYKGGHHFIWDQTYGRKKNLDWLFAQQRVTSEQLRPAQQAEERPGARAGEETAEAAKTVPSDEKAVAKSKAEAAEADCRRLLSLARNYMANNLPDKGRKYLREIIDKYAGTDYAKQAQEMLDDTNDKQ